jgi:two-component system, NtrC family, response regulator HydG
LFLDAFRKQHDCHARTFSALARKALVEFSWPGNVRELLNRVQRAAVVAEGAQISIADLDLQEVVNVRQAHSSLGLTRTSAERDAVVACLRETRFNISECARRLKVSRVTIYRLCKKHQLVLEDMH